MIYGLKRLLFINIVSFYKKLPSGQLQTVNTVLTF